MKYKLPVALLLALGLCGTSPAQTPGAASPEQMRQLIEQKIKLLEMLVNSPAAKSAAYGREADSAALVDKSRKSIAAAKQALAQERSDEASRMLDDALKSSSAASRRLSAAGAGLSESAQRQALADMTEQVVTYRAAVVDLTRDGKVGGDAKALLGRLDALTAESKQLADAGRLGDANKKLAAAYKLGVEELSKLRAGHEVVISLKFDTPADEYAYEQRRFGSNVTLVDMMVAEGRAEGPKRMLVDKLVGEADKLKGTADGEAKAGNYKEAVALMEKATGQLNRALQTMGIPVF